MHHGPVRLLRTPVNDDVIKPKPVIMKSIKAPKIRPSTSMALGHTKGSEKDMCPMQLSHRHPAAMGHTKPTKQKVTLTVCTYSDTSTKSVESGMEDTLTMLTLSP